MIDIGVSAGEFESVRAERFPVREHLLDFRWAPGLAAGIGKVNSVVGEHRVDFIGNSLDQREEKVSGDSCRGSLMQFDESEFRRAVDRHEHIEFALGGAHLGDVDMEIADRIGVELPLGGNFPVDLRQL